MHLRKVLRVQDIPLMWWLRRLPQLICGGVLSGKQFAETVTFKVTDTSVEIQNRREIICRMGHHLICRTTS